METQFTVAFVIRGILALGFLATGVTALVMGGRFYSKGIGLAPDGSTIATKHGKLNVQASLKTVGSVVMATSIGWGCLAYLSLPKETGEKRADGSIKISVASTNK